MVLDPSDSKPIIAFNDWQGMIQIRKWNTGTSWTDMGTLNDNDYDAVFVSLSIGNDNKPVILIEWCNWFSDEIVEFINIKNGKVEQPGLI
jgi:hypothetical protein